VNVELQVIAVEKVGGAQNLTPVLFSGQKELEDLWKVDIGICVMKISVLVSASLCLVILYDCFCQQFH
jgi:hypothetical protein